MSVTLMDYLKVAEKEDNALYKGFCLDLLRAGDLMPILKFKDVKGLSVGANRWQTLPDVGFRKLNDGYTESTGTTEDLRESLALFGGDVKIDTILTKVKNVDENPLETQMKMKAKALAFKLADTFINGSIAVDPDSFDGLKVRVSNMPSRMTYWLDSDGDGTNDALKVLASDANTHLWLDAVEAAYARVGGATHIFANETTLLGFGKAMRRIGDTLMGTEKIWEKEFDKYKKAVLVDIGLKADKTTEIITSTEDPGDGGNDATSMYFVRMDTDEGLHGIQLAGTSPKPYDPLNGGELSSGPQKLRRIDWALGLMNRSNYCICRVAGFKMAAS